MTRSMNIWLMFFFIFSITCLQPIQKKALITGIIGQDGSYLTELLQGKGYEVYGIDKHIKQDLLEKYFSKPVVVYEADISDTETMKKLLTSIKPDEIYNLAAQSNVTNSYERPELTAIINAIAPLKILEIIRQNESLKNSRFFQASSCEMFGDTKECPQNELTPLSPQSPYAISKVFAYSIIKTYRKAYGLFACNGILFNHESPRRPPIFVTRKVIQTVARIKCGLQDVLEVGNLDVQRDWGHARDYVNAMWLMLQQEQPDDYIIATGERHSVRKFIELAFKSVGMQIVWQGKGLDEIGIDQASGKLVVKINKSLFRPLDGKFIQGDNTKAKKILQWQPQARLNNLIQEMMEAELKEVVLSTTTAQNK